MDAIILDGKKLAAQMRKNLKERVQALMEKSAGEVCTLATILVGNDPASATYVKMKQNACAKVGLGSLKVEMAPDTSQQELLKKIDELNKDHKVRGILLQHPISSHLNERECFNRIDIEKDVDGVTCQGFGMMAMGEPAYGCATPKGIMTLLEHYDIDLNGKDVVVVGRSPILGKPLAMMMLNKHATVTICHSRTQNLSEKILKADIVVGAVGIPKFIQSDWLKEGVVLIDAGYHPKEACGDIDLEKAAVKAQAYTPVPGGVGPMTIVSLIEQTVESAEKFYNNR